MSQPRQDRMSSAAAMARLGTLPGVSFVGSCRSHILCRLMIQRLLSVNRKAWAITRLRVGSYGGWREAGERPATW